MGDDKLTHKHVCLLNLRWQTGGRRWASGGPRFSASQGLSGERPAGKSDREPGVRCRTNREMSSGLRPPALAGLTENVGFNPRALRSHAGF